MVVQHNLSAMNTNRQMGTVSSALQKSTEKLSSGYRINRAADDAAGLSISEKMRGFPAHSCPHIIQEWTIRRRQRSARQPPAGPLLSASSPTCCKNVFSS